jgi:Holliday junction resolvase RusA-like endonuclease
MMLKLKILGVPMAKQSFRFTRSGRKYQPAEVGRYENNIQAQIISQLPENWEPFAGPVKVVTLVYTFLYLKSQKRYATEKILIPKTTKPDLTDNLNKSLFDAMQSIVYVNDSQVWAMDDVKKIYGPIPGIDLVMELYNES